MSAGPPRPKSRWLGCWRRSPGSCPFPAPPSWRASRKTWPRPRSCFRRRIWANWKLRRPRLPFTATATPSTFNATSIAEDAARPPTPTLPTPPRTERSSIGSEAGGEAGQELDGRGGDGRAVIGDLVEVGVAEDEVGLGRRQQAEIETGAGGGRAIEVEGGIGVAGEADGEVVPAAQHTARRDQGAGSGAEFDPAVAALENLPAAGAGGLRGQQRGR